MILSSLLSPVILLIMLVFLFGYMIGSIPFGLLIAKMSGYGDIRDIGSGNIGATNVLRTGNKQLAAATLLADILKGFLPVVLTTYFLSLYGFKHGAGLAIIAGFGAFIGHLYPAWLKFKGGKGVATFIGILFGYQWQLGAIFVLTWIATAYLSRISSFSALTASLVTLFMTFISGVPSVFFILMTGLIYWKHKDNITRLMDGTETRIGQDK